MHVYTGEFGIIYKAQLINWLWYEKDMPVAVKRLKGNHYSLVYTSTDSSLSLSADIIKYLLVHVLVLPYIRQS